jgi:aspartate kinase
MSSGSPSLPESKSAQAPGPPLRPFEKYRGVTRVTVERHLSHLTVPVRPTAENLRRIFSAVARANVSLILIKLHEHAVHMALSDWEAGRAAEAIRELGCDVRVVPGCSLVTIVAADMRSLHGIMARIVRSLAAEDVEILEIDDAYDSVSCLVRGDRQEAAVAALRREFGLEE